MARYTRDLDRLLSDPDGFRAAVKSACAANHASVPLARSVLLVLAAMANLDGECWPTTKYIADQVWSAERNVERVFRALEDCGLVTSPGYRDRAKLRRIALPTSATDGGGDDPTSATTSATDGGSESTTSATTSAMTSAMTSATHGGQRTRQDQSITARPKRRAPRESRGAAATKTTDPTPGAASGADDVIDLHEELNNLLPRRAQLRATAGVLQLLADIAATGHTARQIHEWLDRHPGCDLTVAGGGLVLQTLADYCDELAAEQAGPETRTVDQALDETQLCKHGAQPGACGWCRHPNGKPLQFGPPPPPATEAYLAARDKRLREAGNRILEKQLAARDAKGQNPTLDQPPPPHPDAEAKAAALAGLLTIADPPDLRHPRHDDPTLDPWTAALITPTTVVVDLTDDDDEDEDLDDEDDLENTA